jgi:hypothetical protein
MRQKNTLISDKHGTLNLAVNTIKNLHDLWQMRRLIRNKVNMLLPSNAKRKLLRSHPGTRHFPLFQTAQTGSAAHPASNSIGTEVLSWGKAAGREVEHSPRTSTEVKNEWSYISTSQYVFMAQTGITSTFYSKNTQISTSFRSRNSFK